MSKLRTLLPVLVLACLPLTSLAGTLPQPKVHKINEQVYALLSPVGLPDEKNRGYMANSTLIIGKNGAIIIDTGFSHEIGLHLKKTIARITQKPITHVINTHHHGDHVLGNSAFKGATIISSELCREWTNKTAYQWISNLENMTKLKFPKTKPVTATQVYPQQTRHKVTIQGVNLELWLPKGSHTAGDMMVYLPQHKILITGDIVVNQMIPSFITAHVKSWIETLGEIDKWEINTIIPGHGKLLTKNDVKIMHSHLQELYKGIEAGYKKGLSDFEIRKTLNLTEWKKMVGFDRLMGIAVNRTFLEVEAENF